MKDIKTSRYPEHHIELKILSFILLRLLEEESRTCSWEYITNSACEQTHTQN